MTGTDKNTVQIVGDTQEAVDAAAAEIRRVMRVRAALCARLSARPRAQRTSRGAPPPLRTKRTRRVPYPVLIGHAASLTPY